MSTFDEIRRIRIEKAKKLRELGINPYPAQSQKDYSNSEISEKYEALADKKVHVSGRVISWREHGQLIFCHIQDQSGKLQIFIKKNDLSKTSSKNQTIGAADLKLIDIGDFIEVFGTVSKSIKGEVSIFPGDIKLLTKSIRSLPEKWSGLTDPEIIFRRRYLDLVMNPDRKDLFIRKSKFWQLTRLFLSNNGFIEVETPILELVTGGADAKPFITHHNALDQDFYLRISTELFQKRLVGGGFEKIFTLGPNFRNEGIDDEHLQEYYSGEWYWAYADYNNNMDLVEKLYKYLAQNIYGKTKFTRGVHTYDLADKWERISYADLIKKRFSVDIFNDSEEKILKLLKEQHIDTEGLNNRGRIVDNLWKIVRQEISGPIFVIDEPKFSSPLAKSRSDDPTLTERFHCIIAGSELGNGYSELNDPIDQFERFADQQNNRENGDEESQMMDIDFVEMLEYGMPPTSGFGFSERLFWFLENVTAREGTLFPQVKYELSEETKKTYNLVKAIEKKEKIKITKKTEDKKIPTESLSKIDRQQFYEAVKSNLDTNIFYHSLALEACMGGIYDYLNSQNELDDSEPSRAEWVLAGLVHDIDYAGDTKDQHPLMTLDVLKKYNLEISSVIDRIVKDHDALQGMPANKAGWALRCADSLTGLITAVAMVYPSKKLEDVKVSSVLKRFLKEPKFAAGTRRDEVILCQDSDKLNISLEKFIEICLESMRKIAPEIKL